MLAGGNPFVLTECEERRGMERVSEWEKGRKSDYQC